jgi:hypothetical protein
MGELHRLSADLPILSRPDKFRKLADAARQLWRDSYDASAGGLTTQRAWLERHASLAPMLPSLREELDAIQRLATRSEIADALSTMREVLKTGNRPPTAGSNRILAERVGAAEPTIGALNFAALHLIDTVEWWPAPAVVLTALAAAADRLRWIGTALDGLPDQAARMRNQLADSEADERKWLEQQARRRMETLALQAACRDIVGDDSPDTIRSLIGSGDEALKDKVRAARDAHLVRLQA